MTRSTRGQRTLKSSRGSHRQSPLKQGRDSSVAQLRCAAGHGALQRQVPCAAQRMQRQATVRCSGRSSECAAQKGVLLAGECCSPGLKAGTPGLLMNTSSASLWRRRRHAHWTHICRWGKQAHAACGSEWPTQPHP